MKNRDQASFWIKSTSLGFLCVVFLISFNGVSRKLRAQKPAPWLACIDGRSNTLFFNALNSKVNLSDGCSGPIKYTVSKSLDPIQNLNDDSTFGQLRAGTKRVVKLNNGRRFSVSQWKNSSNSNFVLVLEPNLKRKNVRKVCVLKNESDMMATRYDSRRKKLLVRVATHKNGNGDATNYKWKSCKI